MWPETVATIAHLYEKYRKRGYITTDDITAEGFSRQILAVMKRQRIIYRIGGRPAERPDEKGYRKYLWKWGFSPDATDIIQKLVIKEYPGAPALLEKYLIIQNGDITQ